MVAMINANVDVDNYYAYEIDKYAIRTSQHNFPQIKQCGDVFDDDYSKYKGIDYLIGGSPCTYWSIAQSPDKRETIASGMGWDLFSQYIRALREAQPRYFIYENNKSMSKAIYQSISEVFGFEPICINSALVSAQNRQRLYWVGKRNSDGTYSKVDIKQPKDKGILLKDIIDNGYDLTANNKSYTLTASYNNAVAWNSIERSQRNMVIVPVNTTINGKSQTIKAQYSNTDVNNICRYASTYGASGVAEPIDKPIRVGVYPTSDGRMLDSQGMRIYSIDGKSVTQSAQGGGMGAKTGLYAIAIEFDGDIPTKAISYADGKTYKVYKVKDGQITIKEKQYPIKLQDGYYIIRKLTVSECKRLQTVPDWFEFPVSNTQAYRQLGNGWTCDVITHLIKATL